MFTLPGSQIPEGKQVLVLEDLVLPHVPVPPLSWRMDGPMRVALKGPNGCGKSTLLKAILGDISPRSGTCKVSVSCAYLDQHLSRLDLSQSVMTHLNFGQYALEEGMLRTRLAQLQLGADKVSLPLAELSGGERLKAALACVLWRGRPRSSCCWMNRPTIWIWLQCRLLKRRWLVSRRAAGGVTMMRFKRVNVDARWCGKRRAGVSRAFKHKPRRGGAFKLLRYLFAEYRVGLNQAHQL